MLRPFSSLFQSIRHLKQIKSLGNKQARRYEVGKHRRRVSGIREQDERKRSLSGDNASRSNQDCSNNKALVMKQMNGWTKGGRMETIGLLHSKGATFLLLFAVFKSTILDSNEQRWLLDSVCCSSCFVPVQEQLFTVCLNWRPPSKISSGGCNQQISVHLGLFQSWRRAV